MARILVVDDNEDVRAMLRRLLERAGYEVDDMADGNAAIKSYREQPADLIIIDLLMPEKLGMTAIPELRQDFPDVKIIAISGVGQDFLTIARTLGAARTFTKPLEPDEVLKAVKDLVGPKE